jgi:probable F420-dependent oxidoreductase
LKFAVELAGGHGRTDRSGLDQIIEDARIAEDLGFGAVFIPDHYVFERLGNLEVESPAYELFFVLATLAQRTEKLELASHVACVLFRHPAMHARLFAQLDEASGGRVIAGVGAGWTRAEFEMMGIGFPAIAERLRMLDESVTVMRGLWRNERYTFEGEYYRVIDAACLPKPVRPGGPPIMLGGSGPGILRRAGAWADIIHMVPHLGGPATTRFDEVAKFTDAALATKLELVRTAEAAAGRTPGSVKLATTAFNFQVTSSARETREAAEPVAGLLGLSVDDVLHHPAMLVGTVEEIAAELTRRREVHGLQIIGINHSSTEQLRTFGEKVVPRLA